MIFITTPIYRQYIFTVKTLTICTKQAINTIIIIITTTINIIIVVVMTIIHVTGCFQATSETFLFN